MADGTDWHSAAEVMLGLAYNSGIYFNLKDNAWIILHFLPLSSIFVLYDAELMPSVPLQAGAGYIYYC